MKNRLRAGRRFGRVTIWIGARSARHFRVEDLRRYGGDAVSISVHPFPGRHSDLNVDLLVRLGGRRS